MTDMRKQKQTWRQRARYYLYLLIKKEDGVAAAAYRLHFRKLGVFDRAVAQYKDQA